MAFSMASQTPAITERVVVCSSSSEYNNHTSSGSGLTQCSRMVDSGGGGLTFILDFSPDKWRFLNIEYPAVIDRFLADVTTEDDKVGFGKGESVAVAFSGGFVGYIDDIPHANAVSNVEMVKVVGGKSSRAGGSTKNYDFIRLDADGSVSGTGRGGSSRC
jgi:hypothetical protein